MHTYDAFRQCLLSFSVYYFTISNTPSGTTGTFDVCTSTSAAPASCVDNDLCTSPDVQSLVTSSTTCITDCNTGAVQGPDFTGANCEDFLHPTVWYEFTTGSSDASIDITLNSVDLSNPHYAIFSTTDCLSFAIIDCIQGSGGSASGTTILATNTTYLIAVSDVNGDEGNFDLCMTLNPDNSACNTDNDLSVTATSMGSPLTGPFQGGEIVTFCYTINQYLDNSQCNYLQGIVPSFGNCWDPVSLMVRDSLP